MDHLLTVVELCDYLRCPKSTVYKMTCAKKIPYTKVGGVLRFYKEKIDKWLEEKSVDPIAS
jgi:excisionase family DNA binding protein